MRASRWSIRGSFGTVVDGRLEGEGRTYNISPGFVASASIARQWVSADWFVTGSFGMSVSRTTTVEEVPGAERQTLIATDLFRVGAMAGRTFGIVSPYVLVRGFAGPVFWSLDDMDVGGSDTHFFQLGAGASLATESGLTFVLDVSALGEQSASLGMAIRL